MTPKYKQKTLKDIKSYIISPFPLLLSLTEEELAPCAVTVAEQTKKQVTSPENYRQLTLTTSEHPVDKSALTGNLLGEAVQNRRNNDCSAPEM